MKINIHGQNGVFGGFLTQELPKFGFEITECNTHILAVPFSAYEIVAQKIDSISIEKFCRNP